MSKPIELPAGRGEAQTLPANFLAGAALAILPEAWREMTARLQLRQSGDAPAAATTGGRDRTAGGVRSGSVAILPLFGVLDQRPSWFLSFFGGTSTQQFGREFDAAIADSSVQSVLILVDSPGGSVIGTPELADKIAAARGGKRIIAGVDGYAASAAYWIASQADELYVTQSGQVGSIGVIAVHQDFSQADRMMGVKSTAIAAGKFKGEGDPSFPLTEAAKADMQKKVDTYYGMFVSAVARGRGVNADKVKNGFAEGRMATAALAVSLGMADGVMTPQQIIEQLAGGAGKGRGQGGATLAEARLTGFLATVRARLCEVEMMDGFK
jgi:signal peptide peptidase SppA